MNLILMIVLALVTTAMTCFGVGVLVERIRWNKLITSERLPKPNDHWRKIDQSFLDSSYNEEG